MMMMMVVIIEFGNTFYLCCNVADCFSQNLTGVLLKHSLTSLMLCPHLPFLRPRVGDERLLLSHWGPLLGSV